jgi:hypothetical protein
MSYILEADDRHEEIFVQDVTICREVYIKGRLCENHELFMKSHDLASKGAAKLFENRRLIFNESPMLRRALLSNDL